MDRDCGLIEMVNSKSAKSLIAKKSCGCCKKILNGTELGKRSMFEVTCSLCNRRSILKVDCAVKFFYNLRFINDDSLIMNLSPKIFRKNCQHKFFCKLCKLAQCFYCKSIKHQNSLMKKVCDGCMKKWCIVLLASRNKRPKKCQRINRGRGLCLECTAVLSTTSDDKKRKYVEDDDVDTNNQNKKQRKEKKDQMQEMIKI